ncbi:hypothetical protein N7456_002127 [Penicillium angulare]|uniref:Uncharacterized protein n=1 Tax=Penicillium angulare TaxID=116970 RepID=A0A9W9KQ11_9EURO|nr:hypothetical protein N7456_002127 [Penicillium angulare]
MPTGAPYSVVLLTGTSQRLTLRPAAESLVNLKNFWASVNSPGRLEMNKLSREKRMASALKVAGGDSWAGTAEKVGVEDGAFPACLVRDIDIAAVVGIDKVGVAIAVSVPEAHLEAGNDICDHRQCGSIVTAGLGLSLEATVPARGGSVVIQPGHLIDQIAVVQALVYLFESGLGTWDSPQIDVELAVGNDGLDALEGTPLLKVLIVLGGGDIGSVGAHVEHNGAKQRAVDLVTRVCSAAGSEASGGQHRQD